MGALKTGFFSSFLSVFSLFVKTANFYTANIIWAEIWCAKANFELVVSHIVVLHIEMLYIPHARALPPCSAPHGSFRDKYVCACVSLIFEVK